MVQNFALSIRYPGQAVSRSPKRFNSSGPSRHPEAIRIDAGSNSRAIGFTIIVSGLWILQFPCTQVPHYGIALKESAETDRNPIPVRSIHREECDGRITLVGIAQTHHIPAGLGLVQSLELP